MTSEAQQQQQTPLDAIDDRTADVAAAFDSLEADIGEKTPAASSTPVIPVVDTPAAVPAEKPAPAADKDATPPPPGTPPGAAKKDETLPPQGEPSDKASDKPPAASPDGNVDKPPQSWTPTVREHWAALPPEVKTQIMSREQHTDKLMRESADLRLTTDNVGKLFDPFKAMFQAQGLNAWEGTHTVLNTAAQLMGGSKIQKALVVSQLISDYGVDIAALDDLIVGKMPQTSRDDELADLRAQLNQQQQWQTGQQEQQQQRFNVEREQQDKDISTFYGANPFAEELRYSMADFMDLAERGPEGTISLDIAYQRAVAARPDIQQVIANRASGQSNTDALTKARAAGVSVPQTSQTGNNKPTPGTTREAILDAWDHQ